MIRAEPVGNHLNDVNPQQTTGSIPALFYKAANDDQVVVVGAWKMLIYANFCRVNLYLARQFGYN